MPISCHEHKRKFFKTRPIRPKSSISIPYRYPADTLPIPDFRNTRSRFASRLDAPGPKLDRTGPIPAHLRRSAGKETDATTDFGPDCRTRRRCGPRRDPLRAQKHGRLHPRHRRTRCRETPLSNGRIRSTCPGPMMTFGRCSLTAAGYLANIGAKTLPDIPIPYFVMHPPVSVRCGVAAGRKLRCAAQTISLQRTS